MATLTIDVGLQRQRFLADDGLVALLPPDLIQLIRAHTHDCHLLDALAAAALLPRATTRIFVHFETIFADICARWLPSSPANPHSNSLLRQDLRQQDQVIAAFARILPFAPHLTVFLDRYLRDTSEAPDDSSHPALNSLRSLDTLPSSPVSLLSILLACWRLLSLSRPPTTQLVRPSLAQTLFRHNWAPIRLLAIRIFCLQIAASDYKLHQLLSEHVAQGDNLVADYDGLDADYAFLSLLEHKRANDLDSLRKQLRQSDLTTTSPIPSSHQLPQSQLSPLVARYGSVLLPRPAGVAPSPTNLVRTETTESNLQSLAGALHSPEPILLHGLPGSGKTSLVHELARELGTESSMVTLHLNEQTDAKMLIGLYSTGSKPGSFSWRPGVLTTAVKEGRWVLIEDLDRAPNEVMSTLLPLVEHGRLLIPSRAEVVQAPTTFRLFATVRTARGAYGQESLPNFLGQRFWRQSGVRTPPTPELESILVGQFPLLQSYSSMIMSVYERLYSLQTSPSTSRATADRPVTPRDLLKWCRRIKELLTASGCKSGDESISETTRGWMFMEAVDCFSGSMPKPEFKEIIINLIAESMHVPEQLRDHYLKAQVPQIEETPSTFRVGRVTLTRRKHASKNPKQRGTFANTSHAKRLLEQLAAGVKLREPVLLVGETGIGKTTVVQQLADVLGHKLVAVNLSQQSEAGDLLGGFKPVNVRSLAVPLKEEFEDLFAATGISASRNQKYLEQIGRCAAKGQWVRVSKLWREAPKMFAKILDDLQTRSEARTEDDSVSPDQPAAKRRKTGSKLQSLLELRPRWETFAKSLDQFDVQLSGGAGSFAFAFVEGNIVKAARNGDWVLLDEINLASPDTLESIADLFAAGPGDEPSILLSETGEIERVKAHPDFRIFGAMNPATDIGKRDLPLGLRSRFTELYVSGPDRDLKDLLTIIKAYLGGKSAKDEQAADDVARLYLSTKSRAQEKRLVDGANEVPHFSLRTLTRVLSYVNETAPLYGLRRSLFEGFSMGFLTLLDRASEETLVPLIHHYLLDKHGGARSLLSQPPKHPSDGRQYVKFMNNVKDRQYWILRGEESPLARDDYIITPYIERNLLNLVRATSTRKFPILIQGPTSAGKTSMVEYLANFSGNKFVRINNHEHTDLQEYLGTYVSDMNGKLRFQEGLLVQALRRGYWIVLDELNLAPTDVLEALNRLLDDNRELLIPETQEVVRPHENFMLFATQNPPGLYGGRKALSRAFRNRFLELHFDDIPESELETILQKRSIHTAPSDCKRIVTVYKELSRLRQSSRLFENKDSFATLRDLFRWAMRKAETRGDIANNGFMLLAERVRNEEERMAVKRVIEGVFKVKIDLDSLYENGVPTQIRKSASSKKHGVVWTHAMRRLYTLVASALDHNEPVLLVGETGCGKTTICQVLADALEKQLHIVNAHQNTETGDLIGSQRPIRNRGAIADCLGRDVKSALQHAGSEVDGSTDEMLLALRSLDPASLATVPDTLLRSIAENEVKSKALFEWADGSLVHAMRDGQLFLLDEISLADDSVLERLNSVLEPQRSLLLAEKGTDDSSIKALEGFQFLATMNPGGDFGKKELSPALRNRFTEIWVSPLSANEDVLEIVSSKLIPEFRGFSRAVVEFSNWFGQTFRSTASTAFSIRDILVWVKFINESDKREKISAVVHGASTVFIDTIGANPSALMSLDPKSLDSQRQRCLDKLTELLKSDATTVYRMPVDIAVTDTELRIGAFSMSRAAIDDFGVGFALHAPTTKLNAMRIVRALRVQKPILLEGSPGVGKTTLVTALAKACGQPLTRINLSDQTDLMDLFGTDVPVEGAEAGHFAWRDAPFLRAMQNGEWVLLDEMNLASQSVLEGLNACLDHRGEVYVAELDHVFRKHPDFRLFAAQNPHHQGGGRKGLPSSFVNRFVVVYADVFTQHDLLLIAEHSFPGVPTQTIQEMIQFISDLESECVVKRTFGQQGSPWEFNLRDTLRWLQLLTSTDKLLSSGTAGDFLDIAIKQRFRSLADRREVDSLFFKAFGVSPKQRQLYHTTGVSSFQVGLAMMPRSHLARPSRSPSMDVVARLSEIESLLVCVKQNLPCILVGPSGCGKSMLLQHVASQAGQSLVTFPMNADIDTMDLVGGFEQSDPLREVNTALRTLQSVLRSSILRAVPGLIPNAAVDLLSSLGDYTVGVSEPGALLGMLNDLKLSVQDDEELKDALGAVESLLQQTVEVSDARFEWLDGIIVQALQNGQWLVLDNANLCSASVLDRLNSLLEPNGHLIINEHCGPNGEPRIIKPNPNFRIFLTVDPRYGELSRAMRNRAIEIYMEPSEACLPSWHKNMPEQEPAMQRLGLVLAEKTSNGAVPARRGQHSTDALSYNDQELIHRHESALQQMFGEAGKATNPVYSTSAIDVRKAIVEMYSTLPADLFSEHRHMQPVHPLQNSSLLPILRSSHSDLPFWLAVCYETFIEVLYARNAVLTQRAKAQGVQISGLNRLQRSCVAESAAAVSKDSTVAAARFLEGLLASVEVYARQHASDFQPWKENKTLFRLLLHFWWMAYRGLTAPAFDEARFQAILGHMSRVLTDRIQEVGSPRSQSLAQQVLQGLGECFISGFQLATGLKMEQLWQILRPSPINSADTLKALRRMEDLSLRLDLAKWNCTIPPLDRAKITDAFVRAYSLISFQDTNAHDLLATLESAADQFEQTPQQDSSRPFFTAEFETLRQVMTLDCMARGMDTPDVSSETTELSNLSLLAQMRLFSAPESAKPLQAVDYLLGGHSQSQAWNESLTSNVLTRLEALGGASLRTLTTLDIELPILAEKVVASSMAVSGDQLEKLSCTLWRLMSTVLSIIDPGLASVIVAIQKRHASNPELAQVTLDGDGLHFDAQSLLPELNSQDFSMHPAAVGEHLTPAIASLIAARCISADRHVFLATAWTNFALMLIKLYVPDKIFDPQLRSQIEAQSHEDLVSDLTAQLESLESFEKLSTGQTFNVRCEILQEEMEGFGPSPPLAQQVYRPAKSGLAELQGEFNNLLKIVLGADVCLAVSQHDHGSPDLVHQLGVIHENICQIASRLSYRFPAYNDMVQPAVNILRCLQVGLSLVVPSTSPSTANGISEQLRGNVPFAGGRPQDMGPKDRSTYDMHFLAYAGAVSSVEGAQSMNSKLGHSVSEAVHYIYEQWSQKLEADRQNEMANTSLYRHKGSAEDADAAENEDFDELFPTFDEVNDEAAGRKASGPSDARSAAISMARAHDAVFHAPKEAPETILDLCKRASRVSKNSVRTADRMLLPGTLASLDEAIKASTLGGGPGSTYNFYVDSNLPEVRILVKLVNDIKARFQALQQIDEIGHMQPLSDVLGACDKVFELQRADPLAKIIPKVEQLHAFVYEWQFGGWVSKIYAVPTLYSRLTEMIVNWRRLELSTWSKLFDMELAKQNDDADAWWFVAYQAVIAGPLSISQTEQDLAQHTVKLLIELEKYFVSSPVGQFQGRLKLLTQLLRQLEFLVVEVPSLVPIRTALANFVDFYSRFQVVVLESIARQKGVLEKQMKDVLLLASWKDTNIVALRESARKSHQKLFRIVRKYRDILNQPMKPIIEQGLPDRRPDEISNVEQGASVVRIDSAVLIACEKGIPGWAREYKRLANAPQTIRTMEQLGRMPRSAVDAAEAVDAFLADLESSTADLRKETPAFLSDENKDFVKHLRSRKRKLFAETLKAVRLMGFSFHLGTDVLDLQNSAPVILANSEPLASLECAVAANTNYYFHKIIDLAPRARAAAYDHSDEITGAEIERSVGLIEGILRAVLTQRSRLVKASTEFESLSTLISGSRGLVEAESNVKSQQTGTSVSPKTSTLWLLEILKVGVKLLDIHGRLGKKDNSSQLDSFKAWSAQLQALVMRWDTLPRLPKGLVSAAQTTLEGETELAVKSLKRDIAEACKCRPDLAFLLEQIEHWTKPNLFSTEFAEEPHAHEEVTALYASVQGLCNKVLVAVQHYHKVLGGLPTEPDEAGWLVKSGDGLASALGALRISKIEESLSTLIDAFKRVDLSAKSSKKIATSLMTIINAILDQYRRICQDGLARLGGVHHSVCKLGYSLSKDFIRLASQGFCTPQEKSDETSGESGKVESGTGLGDGEGADDISKDIQPDEDLSELAQDGQKGNDQDIEDEKDAVDMADEELEGDLNSVDGKEEEDDDNKSQSGEDQENDMDEETGDVDDLDPTAVDEKTWDNPDESQAEKDQEGDQSKGQKTEDDPMPADQKPENSAAQQEEPAEQGNEEEEEEEQNGAEQDEEISAQQQEELNHQEQTAEEQDALALPDDMEIDKDDKDSVSSISDDELDNLSNVDEQEAPADDGEAADQKGDEDTNETTQDEPQEPEADDTDAQGDTDANMEEPEGQDEQPEDPMLDEDVDRHNKDDNNAAEPTEAAPSDVKSGGQDDNATSNEDEQTSEAKAAEQEQGQMGENAADQDMSAGNKGSTSKKQEDAPGPESDELEDAGAAQPFKALGDALERFHRQQRDITKAQDKEEQGAEQPQEQESAVQEYQHLQNEDDAADTQALGGANEEMTQPVDDSMAIDDEELPPNPQAVPDNEDEAADPEQGETDEVVEDRRELDQEESTQERQSGVTTHQGAYKPDSRPQFEQAPVSEEVDDDIQDTSMQLSETHLTSHQVTLRDFDESLRQWTAFQSSTHPLSLALTSQLRLILTPSQSTKLSGAFRTGKRLNIKRIIPYIASSYKRDKIWMRRAVPTKRSYQVLLCLDDSKSMGECSAGSLALESLVMVSRSLSMLEVGQIGVLGFGEHCFMAHDFVEPFASHDAGAKVLQQFSFKQDHTNIQLLVRETIERFRNARLQGPGRGSEDLWQLALILSDGLTPSSAHEEIQRLLREAMEERIMIVFIVMDDTTNKNSQSVVNLKKVSFLGNDEIKTEYYLDTFPFQYYLIVHDLEDLPGALAGLLRSWFAEVNAA